jgi:hypothetical protein
MNHTIVVNEPTTNGQRHFGVVFADGTRTDYSVSSVDDLKNRLRADSDRLDKAAALVAIPVDAEVDTAPEVKPPTDREVFLKAVAALEFTRGEFARLIAQKVVTDTEPTYLTKIAQQEADAKAAFKPEVVGVSASAVAVVP